MAETGGGGEGNGGDLRASFILEQPVLYPAKTRGFFPGPHSALQVPFPFTVQPDSSKAEVLSLFLQQVAAMPKTQCLQKWGACSSLVKVASAPGKLRGKIDGMNVAGASQQCH